MLQLAASCHGVSRQQLQTQQQLVQPQRLMEVLAMALQRQGMLLRLLQQQK
jgi:hypothetical protein